MSMGWWIDLIIPTFYLECLGLLHLLDYPSEKVILSLSLFLIFMIFIFLSCVFLQLEFPVIC